MTPRPQVGSVWRKHFAQSSHAARFTYTVMAVTAKTVKWRRSDGLEGEDTLFYWESVWEAVS